MNNDILTDIVNRSGTPCFVYDFDQVRDRVAKLHDAFGGRFTISYAMKANPNPAILQRMRSCVPGLDVSSGGELQRALSLGWPPRDISFTGPAKRPAELSLAVESKIGAVVVESVREAIELNDLARAAGTRQTILLRISPTKVPPGFGSRMAGRPSQFGVDEEDARRRRERDAATSPRRARRLSHLLRHAVPERPGCRPELSILRRYLLSPLPGSSSPCKEADSSVLASASLITTKTAHWIWPPSPPSPHPH